jgi:hypothetical protein
MSAPALKVLDSPKSPSLTFLWSSRNTSKGIINIKYHDIESTLHFWSYHYRASSLYAKWQQMPDYPLDHFDHGDIPSAPSTSVSIVPIQHLLANISYIREGKVSVNADLKALPKGAK